MHNHGSHGVCVCLLSVGWGCQSRYLVPCWLGGTPTADQIPPDHTPATCLPRRMPSKQSRYAICTHAGHVKHTAWVDASCLLLFVPLAARFTACSEPLHRIPTPHVTACIQMCPPSLALLYVVCFDGALQLGEFCGWQLLFGCVFVLGRNVTHAAAAVQPITLLIVLTFKRKCRNGAASSLAMCSATDAARSSGALPPTERWSSNITITQTLIPVSCKQRRVARTHCRTPITPIFISAASACKQPEIGNFLAELVCNHVCVSVRAHRWLTAPEPVS